MTLKQFFSPAEVSAALGVSVTTVKRWVDAGVLPAHKTAGGHRKILLADIVRVVRAGNFPHVELSRLGLAEHGDEMPSSHLTQLLFEALRSGDIDAARTVIHSAYAAGISIEKLGDDVFAPAMSRIGHEWEIGNIDVMHEHRSVQICISVLHELKAALEVTALDRKPLAVGGNPEGDHAVLASLLIQMVLLDAGWQVVNLGPHTPIKSFRVAIEELKPQLLWLSASHIPDQSAFLEQYRALYDEAQAAGVAVAIGGQSVDSCLRAMIPHTFYGGRLSDLTRFADTLHPRPRHPKPGRPKKPS